LDRIKSFRAGFEADERDDTDSLERYVASFTEDERQELAAAEAAIDIAILLHRAREHRGLNQGAAAKLAGLHQQAVSRFERPGANPHIESVRAYLGALDYGLELNVVDLVTGDTAVSMMLPPRARNAAPERAAEETRSQGGRYNPLLARYCQTDMTAIVPSPTAVATRLPKP
jgi:transcriptional regulator with XRE-family HTH domain